MLRAVENFNRQRMIENICSVKPFFFFVILLVNFTIWGKRYLKTKSDKQKKKRFYR